LLASDIQINIFREIFSLFVLIISGLLFEYFLVAVGKQSLKYCMALYFFLDISEFQPVFQSVREV
jgi:hypothetical protein